MSNNQQPENMETGRYDFPWKGNSPGSAELRAKYPLLDRLNVPLGDGNYDLQVRQNIMRELMQFNEQEGYPQALGAGNQSQQFILRIPTFQEQKSQGSLAQRFHHTNQRTKFFDFFLKGLLRSHDKQAALDMLIQYLAKVHNESFMQQVEFATTLFEKNKPKQVFKAPEDLIMYDGGDRENSDHVQWNIRYKQLMQYKEKHGDCSVPSVNNKHARKENERLSRFVSLQRSLDKQDKLPPKRRELLDEIGFVWDAQPGHLKLTDNEQWHKALAAKLFFKSITAHDALIISGFDEDFSSNDSYKKNLNQKVVDYFDGKKMRIRASVDAVLETLKQIHAKNRNYAIVFGESELLTTFMETGKAVRSPQDYRPAKKAKPNPTVPAATAFHTSIDDRKPAARPLPLSKKRPTGAWV